MLCEVGAPNGDSKTNLRGKISKSEIPLTCWMVWIDISDLLDGARRAAGVVWTGEGEASICASVQGIKVNLKLSFLSFVYSRVSNLDEREEGALTTQVETAQSYEPVRRGDHF